MTSACGLGRSRAAARGPVRLLGDWRRHRARGGGQRAAPHSGARPWRPRAVRAGRRDQTPCPSPKQVSTPLVCIDAPQSPAGPRWRCCASGSRVLNARREARLHRTRRSSPARSPAPRLRRAARSACSCSCPQGFDEKAVRKAGLELFAGRRTQRCPWPRSPSAGAPRVRARTKRPRLARGSRQRFANQQEFLRVAALLARERRLSRLVVLAQRAAG